MTLVRILVDGYGLLEDWKDLAPEKSRHSEAAREELIHWLTTYSDAVETAVSIVFDGSVASVELALMPPASHVEVMFSRPGQTPGQLMERLARRLIGHGEFLVVTDSPLVQEKIQALGGLVSTCQDFHQKVRETLTDLERQIASLNQKENQKFTQHG